MKKKIERAIRKHIKDGGLVTAPEKLAAAIWPDGADQELRDLLERYGFAVASFVGENGSPSSAKRQDRLLKAIYRLLGISQTNEE